MNNNQEKVTFCICEKRTFYFSLSQEKTQECMYFHQTCKRDHERNREIIIVN